MNLKELIKKLDLTIFATPTEIMDIHPTGGYAADLLSCAMASAKPGNIWVTLQAHINIAAVAALTEVCAVIISEGSLPDNDLLEKANSQGLLLLGSSASTYQVAGRLWELGIH